MSFDSAVGGVIDAPEVLMAAIRPSLVAVWALTISAANFLTDGLVEREPASLPAWISNMSLSAALATKTSALVSSDGVGTVAAGLASGVAACSAGVAAPLVSSDFWPQAAKLSAATAAVARIR